MPALPQPASVLEIAQDIARRHVERSRRSDGLHIIGIRLGGERYEVTTTDAATADHAYASLVTHLAQGLADASVAADAAIGQVFAWLPGAGAALNSPPGLDAAASEHAARVNDERGHRGGMWAHPALRGDFKGDAEADFRAGWEACRAALQGDIGRPVAEVAAREERQRCRAEVAAMLAPLRAWVGGHTIAPGPIEIRITTSGGSTPEELRAGIAEILRSLGYGKEGA